MAPSKLLLVGEIHVDPNRLKRVSRLLELYKPDVISIESSQANYDNHIGIVQRLSNPEERQACYENLMDQFPSANPKTVGHMLFNGFFGLEIAIHDYLLAHAASMVFAENDELAVNYLQHIGGVQWKESLLPETADILDFEVSDLVAEAEEGYNQPLEPMDPAVVPFYELRDDYAQTIIRAQQGVVVHIGGIDHLTAEYKNLAYRLSDLNPKIIKLNEVDALESI